MNTFKFNTEDREGEQAKFPYPKELREEDQFLAELLAEVAPCVRAMQASEGELSKAKRTELLSEIKKIFDKEKK
jgi:hypothetical protein